MTSPRVIAFGEVLWDCLAAGDVLGGAPANFANRLQELDVQVALVSRVGDDTLGHAARTQLGRLGLDVEHVQCDPAHPTGTVDVVLDARASATYRIHPDVAYDFIEHTPALGSVAATAELIYFGTLAQRGAVSRASLAALLAAGPHATRFLDVNLRPGCYTPSVVEQSLQHTDVLKLNDEEVVAIAAMLQLPSSELAAFCEAVITRFDLECCVVTRGAAGAFAMASDGSHVTVRGQPATVVDTIGAGDAFAAGFVASRLRGNDLEASCDAGNLLGARVASQRGGMAPLDEATRRSYLRR